MFTHHESAWQASLWRGKRVEIKPYAHAGLAMRSRIENEIHSVALPMKPPCRKRDDHSDELRKTVVSMGQLLRGGKLKQKTCARLKENPMKHSIRSLRPLLVPALALALFPTLTSAQHYQQPI
jgi:hypothetical protein